MKPKFLVLFIIPFWLTACSKKNADPQANHVSNPIVKNKLDPNLDETEQDGNKSSSYKFEILFYQKFFKFNSIVQLLNDVGEKDTDAKTDLQQALNLVKNTDSRRLFIPYRVEKNHYALIAINQKTGRIIHQDPKGTPIHKSDEHILQVFHDNYLMPQFGLINSFAADFEDFQIDQYPGKDSAIVTFMNIEDLIHANEIKFRKADILYTAANSALIDAKAAEYKKLETDYATFLSSHAFSSNYSKITGISSAFPYRTTPGHTAFVPYNPVADPVCQAERNGQAFGQQTDLVPRTLINSVKALDPQKFPYEDYYIAKNAADPYWATTPPAIVPVPFHNPHIYPPVQNLPKVRGYVIKGDTRTHHVLGAAGGFTPASLFNASLQEAIARAGHGMALGNHAPWLNRFMVTGGTAPQHPVGIPLPDLGWVHPGSVMPIAPGMLHTLHNSFYDYTALNPYMHMLHPVAKATISTTKSPVIAKGFYPNGIIYILYAYGFEMPQPTFAPWNSNQIHTYAHFQQQEITVPGRIPEGNVVAYTNAAGGRFNGNIYIRDELKYEDPEAFEKIYHLLCGR